MKGAFVKYFAIKICPPPFNFIEKDGVGGLKIYECVGGVAL